MLRRLAPALVALLLLAPAAEAKRKPMTLRYALFVAAVYWDARSAPNPCPHPGYRVAGAEEMAGYDARDGITSLMRADRDRCEILASTVGNAYRTDRDNAWRFCRSIVHEVGHLRAQEHAPVGLMAVKPTVVPWGCDHRRAFLRRYDRR